MTPEGLYRRYQELQQYVGWTAADAQRIQSVAAALAPYLPALIDDFYAEIDRHPDARRVITGGPQQIARLKTTLLRCFNRVNERYTYVKTAGEIKILGKNIYDPDISLIELRKSVGMVFQRPNPMPISVYENVLFGLRIHKDPRELDKSRTDEIVEKALTEVGLWNDLKDRLQVKATTLQLEQQQKLCIARLLPLKGSETSS